MYVETIVKFTNDTFVLINPFNDLVWWLAAWKRASHRFVLLSRYNIYTKSLVWIIRCIFLKLLPAPFMIPEPVCIGCPTRVDYMNLPPSLCNLCVGWKLKKQNGDIHFSPTLLLHGRGLELPHHHSGRTCLTKQPHFIRRHYKLSKLGMWYLTGFSKGMDY